MSSMSKTDIVISTSRKPSQRTRSLCKELQVVLPFAIYVQRGKSNFEELLKSSEQLRARLLLVIGEWDGNPGRLDLYSVDTADSVFSFEIEGVRLAREYGAPVRSRSNVLNFSSDSNKESVGLLDLLEKYLRAKSGLQDDSHRAGTRTLSISYQMDGRLRLTFIDSSTRRELGPSITGGLGK
jgi:rRNA maturation protein Rpf1